MFLPPTKLLHKMFFAKAIDIRGAALSVSGALLRWTADSGPNYALFCGKDASDVLLSPSHISIQIYGHKESSHPPAPSATAASLDLGGTRRLMTVRAQLSNLEITPSLLQINLMRDSVAFLHQQHLSYLYRSVPRPSMDLSEAFAQYDYLTPEIRSSRREWWNYIIQAVIVTLRNRSSTKSRMAMRKKYVTIYKKLLLWKIQSLKLDLNDGSSLCESLDAEEEKELDDLHHFFSLRDLLLFRFNVLKSLRKCGTTMRTLRLALNESVDVKGSSIWYSFFLQKRDLPESFQFQKTSPGWYMHIFNETYSTFFFLQYLTSPS